MALCHDARKGRHIGSHWSKLSAPPLYSTINFDAKVRRESFEPVDLFHAHIGGMDAFARGLKIAAAIRADGRLDAFVKNRYRSWDTGIGQDIENGKTSFKQLEAHALKNGEPKLESGRQEFLENLINEFV